jgi:hypothetical protein
MTEFTIAIQHTAQQDDRRQWVGRMLAQFRAEDPSVSVTVAEDAEGKGWWSKYRKALEVAGNATRTRQFRQSATGAWTSLRRPLNRDEEIIYKRTGCITICTISVLIPTGS